jgi:DNA-binding GntR family transcriptional regulator
VDLKIEIPDSRLLTSKVADKIREFIILGKFKPGERLVESKLAESLGISRQPIREAFRILELEHLITLIPRKGAYISEISLQETKEIYEIRAMIEGFAAQLAIPHLTQKDLSRLELIFDLMEKAIRENNLEKVIQYNLSFHQKIVSLSKNGNLAKVYRSMLLPVIRYQKMGLSLHSSWVVSLEEHRRILEALNSRDIKRTEEMCRNHVLKAEKRLIDRLVSSQKGGL